MKPQAVHDFYIAYIAHAVASNSMNTRKLKKKEIKIDDICSAIHIFLAFYIRNIIVLHDIAHSSQINMMYVCFLFSCPSKQIFFLLFYQLLRSRSWTALADCKYKNDVKKDFQQIRDQILVFNSFINRSVRVVEYMYYYLYVQETFSYHNAFNRCIKVSCRTLFLTFTKCNATEYYDSEQQSFE